MKNVPPLRIKMKSKGLARIGKNNGDAKPTTKNRFAPLLNWNVLRLIKRTTKKYMGKHKINNIGDINTDAHIPGLAPGLFGASHLLV